MTLSITATPEPATASVLLEVTDSSGPTTLLDELAATLYARTWSYAPGTKGLAGGLLFFSNTSSDPSPVAATTITGLTVGHIYQATVYAQRGAQATTFSWGTTFGTVPEGSGVWAHTITFTATATSATFQIAAGSATWGLEPLRVQRLVIQDVPAGFTLSLTRSDANGIRSIRLYAGQGITSGSLVVRDFEASLTGSITYTVTTTSTATATATLGLTDTWLMVPVMPQHSVNLGAIGATGYTEENAAGTTVHEIIGAEYDAVTLRPLRRRAGTLEVWCADYAAARAIRTVYARGEVVLLRQADFAGLDMYHVATGRVAVTPYEENTPTRRWKVSIEYREVPVPTAPLAGTLGWDYAASADRNATYAASAAEFPTYADLLIGPA